MSQSNGVFKAAAVATSVLLVGAFVSYRAGAWNIVAAEQPPAIESGNPDSAEQSMTSNGVDNSTTGPTDQSLTVLSGSKSAILVVPPPKSSERPGSTAIMGGSKSLAPVVPPAPPSSNTQAPPR